MHPDPNSCIGSPIVARYKMMSPAKLPISRSPCLTVPPGLSPGALLESPVLLNNIKAEPSPTTGTFSIYSVINKTVASDSLHSPRGTYENNAHDEGSSNDFKFKPHVRSTSRASLSTLGPLASVNPALQVHASCGQFQAQSQTQILKPSQLAQPENTARSSHELTLSVTASAPPTETLQLDAKNGPDEISPSDNNSSSNNNNGSSPIIGVEKSSEDGYNWRKYGQKHVKGCEFPRSYYKCTHPNCQMKKQLERNHNGQITEIIYKGRHDHPKPEPNRRLAIDTILSGRGEASFTNTEDKLSNANYMDSIGNTELSPNSISDDDAEVGGSNHNGDEVAENDDPESKRRKQETANSDATQISKNNREPRVVVQTISEVDILDDGYRWRKYGQKVVKGNPNPRSYYKCTNAGCSVRKHVERASHDPKAVITTYEGKHNHDVPAARNSSHDTATPLITNSNSSRMPTALNGMFRTDYEARPKENNVVSLGLAVGQVHNHEVIYGNSGNRDGFSFKTPALNNSSDIYYPNSGNLVMGP